jgi:hypothetical protein
MPRSISSAPTQCCASWPAYRLGACILHKPVSYELGEKACALARRDEAKAERADHNSRERVAEDCGQADAPEKRDRERGRADQRQRFDHQRFVHERGG